MLISLTCLLSAAGCKNEPAEQNDEASEPVQSDPSVPQLTEEQRKKAEEAERKKKAEEAEQKRKTEEAERKKKAEEDERKRKAAEARRKAMTIEPDEPGDNPKPYNNFSILNTLLSKTSRGAEGASLKILADERFLAEDKSGKGMAIWDIPDAILKFYIAQLSNEFLERKTAKLVDPRDKDIVRVLKENLSGYYMHVPKLEFLKTIEGQPNLATYKITGWSTTKIGADKPNNIAKFFKLLLAGAHFVIADKNNKFHKEVAKLKNSAKNEGHSHYNKQTPRAVNFPDINMDRLNPSPIIAALLVDDAADLSKEKVGTFFQLEGWPYHAKSTYVSDLPLHIIDFATHHATLWNISTYAKSPYSEKRGTTIFLTKGKEPPDQVTSLFLFKLDYKTYAQDERYPTDDLGAFDSDGDPPEDEK
jgi:hypothetical protein